MGWNFEATEIHHLKEKNIMSNKDQYHICKRKFKDITRENHITCGKNTVTMVLGRFLNIFGSSDGFVDKDS